MKYCTHCGKQLPDDAVFCGRCGNRVEPDSETDTAGSGQLKKKTEKKSYITKKSVIIVGIVLAMICAAAGMKAGKLSRQSAQKAKDRPLPSEYAVSSDDFSADLLESMKNAGQDAIAEKDDGADFAFYAGDGYRYTCTMKEVTYQAMYFLRAKNKSEDPYNEAVLFYKEVFHATQTTDDEEKEIVDERDIPLYTYVKFENLRKDSAGDVDVDLTDCKTYDDEALVWYEYKDDIYDMELPGYETEDEMYDFEIRNMKKKYGYIED